MNNELIKVINDKEYHFKFKSKKCIDLEKATGKQFLELLQDSSMGNIARLLKAACVSPEGVDENDLLDDLMVNSSLEKIMLEVIYETATISGIITRADKDKIDKAIDDEKRKQELEDSKKKYTCLIQFIVFILNWENLAII